MAAVAERRLRWRRGGVAADERALASSEERRAPRRGGGQERALMSPAAAPAPMQPAPAPMSGATHRAAPEVVTAGMVDDNADFGEYPPTASATPARRCASVAEKANCSKLPTRPVALHDAEVAVQQCRLSRRAGDVGPHRHRRARLAASACLLAPGSTPSALASRCARFSLVACDAEAASAPSRRWCAFGQASVVQRPRLDLAVF